MNMSIVCLMECIYVCVCMCLCICVCLHVCMRACVCVCMHMCACVYSQTQVCTIDTVNTILTHNDVHAVSLYREMILDITIFYCRYTHQ